MTKRMRSLITKQTWIIGIILLSTLAIRLVLGAQFLLTPDEANYWQWSRHLDLGYHDHPPMIAWTIWLTTSLFGHHEWAVRLPTLVGLSITSFYLYRLAVRWFTWSVALQTVIVSQLLLITNGSALIATPDGLLLPCWAACCYHAACALEDKRAWPWLLTGFWFGLGLLAKYTMLLVLPSLFFAMLVHRTYRQQLLGPWPWIGLVAGSTLFTPVLIWNSRHGWATFRHVLYQGGADDTTFFTLRFLGDFLGSQAALLSPVVFILILLAWGRPRLRQRLSKERASFLLWMSLPGFLVFFLLALHVRIYGNWPAPVYLTALPLIAALFSRVDDQPGQVSRLWQTALLTAAALTLPVLIQVVYPLLPLPLKLDRTSRETVGWDELGQRVGLAAQAMPRPQNTFLFGLRYQFASELAFYMPGQPQTVSINRWTRPNVYDYWAEDAMLIGQDGVGILEDKETAVQVRTLFRWADPVETVELHRTSPWFGPQVVQTLYLFRGYGFKGGLRWVPRQQNDIRAVPQPNSPAQVPRQ